MQETPTAIIIKFVIRRKDKDSFGIIITMDPFPFEHYLVDLKL